METTLAAGSGWQLPTDIDFPRNVSNLRYAVAVDPQRTKGPGIVDVRQLPDGFTTKLIFVRPDLSLQDRLSQIFHPVSLGELILGYGCARSDAGKGLVEHLSRQIGGPVGLAARYRQIVEGLYAEHKLGNWENQHQEFMRDPIVTMALLERIPILATPEEINMCEISRSLLVHAVYMEHIMQFPGQAASRDEIDKTVRYFLGQAAASEVKH